MTASNGVNTYNGSWSVTDDDSSSDDVDFNIAFASPSNFEELNRKLVCDSAYQF